MRSSDTLLLIAQHVVRLLGYANPLRVASRVHRREILQAERRVATHERPLPVVFRRTYVNHPLGERSISVVFEHGDVLLLLQLLLPTPNDGGGDSDGDSDGDADGAGAVWCTLVQAGATRRAPRAIRSRGVPRVVAMARDFVLQTSYGEVVAVSDAAELTWLAPQSSPLHVSRIGDTRRLMCSGARSK